VCLVAAAVLFVIAADGHLQEIYGIDVSPDLICHLRTSTRLAKAVKPEDDRPSDVEHGIGTIQADDS
jgi:hypothetical protein